MKVSKKVLIPVLIVVVLLAAYFIGFFYYNNKYLPGTTINGDAYGGQTPEQVKLAMTTPPSNQLTVLGRSNLQEGVSFSDKHYNTHVDEQELYQIQTKQSRAAWFFAGLQQKEYQVEQGFDFKENEVRDTLSKMRLFSEGTMVSSQDAHIEQTAEGFQIVPEVYGTKIDAKEFQDRVYETLLNGGDTIDLEKEGLYDEPTVFKDSPDLVKQMEQLEKMFHTVITYDFSDRQEVLRYDDFSDWIGFDEKNNLIIDEEAVTQYIKELAYKYDTYYTNRSFNATGIGQITVGGGIYGWQTNVPESANELLEHLFAGEAITVEPVYTIRGLHRETDDIGSTYIEIDLTRQTMWFYKNGQLLVETGIVSGLPGGNRETPVGIGSVWSKEEKRYITADNRDFWVEYWMPVNWTGVGIHDAPWQPAFGGTQYLVSGSHGCINTPYEKVAEIYHQVEINTPVIMYKS